MGRPGDLLQGEPRLAEPALLARRARPRLLEVEGSKAPPALLARPPEGERLVERVPFEGAPLAQESEGRSPSRGDRGSSPERGPGLEPLLGERDRLREGRHGAPLPRPPVRATIAIVDRIFQPARIVPFTVPEILERPPPRLR